MKTTSEVNTNRISDRTGKILDYSGSAAADYRGMSADEIEKCLTLFFSENGTDDYADDMIPDPTADEIHTAAEEIAAYNAAES